MDIVPALDIRNLSHAYGEKQALDDVTFAIPPATFSVLLGLNGAGKTTLFSLITRLYDVRQGSIAIFGHGISKEPGAALRRLGVVFQARTLDLDLSVHQNLAYHAALHGISGTESKSRIAELLHMVDLADRAHDKARSLSGGQMRRIEIARALLHRPPLLLLDEATVGLDIQSRQSIVEFIRTLVAGGISVLWATHLIDEVGEADHVLVLHRGKLVAEGKPATIEQNTGTSSIREAFIALTGAVPIADQPSVRGAA